MDKEYSFGQTLKKIRTEKGFTQTQLAINLGLHYQTVSKWERGIVLPDIAIFDSLSKELDVSIDTLLGEDDGDKASDSFFSAEKLAKTIYSLRKNLNLSQAEFASKINVRADTVSKWERGFICPDILMLLNIAKSFDIKISQVYYGKISFRKSDVEEKETKTKKTKKIYKKIAVILAIVLVMIGMGTLIYFLTDNNSDLINPNSDPKNPNFVFPVENGKVVVHHEDFYHNKSYNYWSGHNGYDICGASGANVYAMFGGTVKEISQDDSLGFKVVVIENPDSYTAIYKYVLVEDLEVGDEVAAGEIIGKIGDEQFDEELWSAVCEHNYESEQTLNNESYPSHIHLEVYYRGFMLKQIDHLFE